MRMNVPASPLSQQNGITAQFRSLYPGSEKADASGYVIPPMTPIFKTLTPERHRRAKRVRYTQDTNVNEYQAAHGQWCHNANMRYLHGIPDPIETFYNFENFLGVSTDGLTDGQTAVAHPEQGTHFTATTRGLATVMCCWENVRNLRIGDPVRVVLARDSGGRVSAWEGIKLKTGNNDGPFTLVHSQHNDQTIGWVVSRPSGGKDCANECTIMLR